MTDNYQRFSEQIENLTPEEATWIRAFFSEEFPETAEEQERWRKERGLDRDFDDDDAYPNFQWVVGHSANADLWLYTDGAADLEQLADFVQLFLKKFRPRDVFTLTYADTCSKPRIGEFGGGWLVVSARDIKYGNTYTMAERTAKQLKQALLTKRSKEDA